MRIRTYSTFIKTDKPVAGYANGLRGFIAGGHLQTALFHNHLPGNSFIYTFPRVLYHIIDGYPLIIGIDEGADAVKLAVPPMKQIMLNKQYYNVVEVTENEVEAEFGITATSVPYSFLTPWLALNQQNYEKYQRLGTWPARKAMLEAILIGNLISMSKSLGYTVPGPLTASIHKMREVKTSLKGTPMLGFLGAFSVNFEIPDYWGIGKSVSRGFGTVKRVVGEGGAHAATEGT